MRFGLLIPVAFTFLCFCSSTPAQTLKPGFDPDEYIEVLKRSAQQVDRNLRGGLPKEFGFERVYISQPVGLHNKWDLWVSTDKKTIAINLRGTTSDKDSWLENFYSAMIPATGTLNLDGKTDIHYKFASDPKAFVHVGWAIGLCSMLADITDKINTQYAKGVRQILVEGHSQGGALAFLLTSYLHYQQEDGKLPKDVVIKTYCSAAPKPGNTYYAYDFDYITRGGWEQTVVNAADWVPEMPFAVQTMQDVNSSPFTFSGKGVSSNMFVRWYTNHIYNSLNRHSRKARKKYEKFLGKLMYKQVRKYMYDLRKPEYAGSFNYTRAGTPVVLEPDDSYRLKFPDTSASVFQHHLFESYYYLVNKIYK